MLLPQKWLLHLLFGMLCLSNSDVNHPEQKSSNNRTKLFSKIKNRVIVAEH